MQNVPINIEEIRQANPDVIVIDHEQDGVIHQFAFARPKRPHIELAMKGGASGGYSRLHNLVLTVLVAPDRAHVIALFDYYPAMPLAIGNKLLEAAGFGGETQINPLAPRS